MTNGDRIRNMTDEELSSFIRATRCCSTFGGDCEGYPFCQSMEGNYCRGIKRVKDSRCVEWLKKEASDECNETD